MDSSSIKTLTGTAEKGSSKKASSPTDGSAFAAAFDEASESKSAGEKKAELVSRKETDKEKAAKEDDKKRAEQSADRKDQVQGERREKAQADTRATEYAKVMQKKDPATLSLAERQAFRLGEFSNRKQPSVMLSQMMAQHGVDVSSLTPQQLAQTMQKLDGQELSKAVQHANASLHRADEHGQKSIKEQAGAAAQTKPQEQQPEFRLDALVATGTPKEAGEAARQEQRRQVLDQILSHIEVRNVANQTEMNLRLNPEYLGEVKIQLVHDEGGIRAKFQTTSKATRDILTETGAELMDGARDRGVRIGALDVELVDSIDA